VDNFRPLPEPLTRKGDFAKPVNNRIPVTGISHAERKQQKPFHIFLQVKMVSAAVVVVVVVVARSVGL
jgi:hypothetical protein